MVSSLSTVLMEEFSSTLNKLSISDKLDDNVLKNRMHIIIMYVCSYNSK